MFDRGTPLALPVVPPVYTITDVSLPIPIGLLSSLPPLVYFFQSLNDINLLSILYESDSLSCFFILVRIFSNSLYNNFGLLLCTLPLAFSTNIFNFCILDNSSNNDIQIILSKVSTSSIPLLTFSVISGTSVIKKYFDFVFSSISLILSSASSNFIRLAVAPSLDKANHIKIISGLLSIINDTISPLFIFILLNLLIYSSTLLIRSSLVYTLPQYDKSFILP